MEAFGTQAYIIILVLIIIVSFIIFRKTALYSLKKNESENEPTEKPLKRPSAERNDQM